MSKDEMFEAGKSVFEKWDKEEVVEYLSSVLSELVSNGVSISACEITPPGFEYVDGILQREYARRDVLSIREQVTLDFAKHDEQVKEKLNESEEKQNNIDKVYIIVNGITKEYSIEEVSEIVRAYECIKYCNEHRGEHLHSEEYLKILNLNQNISKLQSKVEKYRKAFEEEKKERDWQIAEYQKKIEGLTAENKSGYVSLRQEPIDIASDLIKAFCWKGKEYLPPKCVELRQIAEHLLIHCGGRTSDNSKGGCIRECQQAK